jgi:AraC-like DNA-binding protein
LHGIVLHDSSIAVSDLTNYIKEIFWESDSAVRSDGQVNYKACLGSLAGALEKAVLESKRRLQPVTLRERAVNFINENLHNPSLTPLVVIQYLKVSRAHAYRAFRRDGGIGKIILDRRIKVARQYLIDRGDKRQIKQIAFDLGFSSSNHFIRAFVGLFGMTPGAVRELALARRNMDGLCELQAHFKHMHCNVDHLMPQYRQAAGRELFFHSCRSA